MQAITIAALVLLVILIAWGAYFVLRPPSPSANGLQPLTPNTPSLGMAVPGRVWGYPDSRTADQRGGSQLACASLCAAAGSDCQGYNYLPGEDPYCFLVQPGDFSTYPICVAKKAGEVGWWGESRVSTGLMSQKECPVA
jgi:hypothetical protein